MSTTTNKVQRWEMFLLVLIAVGLVRQFRAFASLGNKHNNMDAYNDAALPSTRTADLDIPQAQQAALPAGGDARKEISPAANNNDNRKRERRKPQKGRRIDDDDQEDDSTPETQHEAIASEDAAVDSIKSPENTPQEISHNSATYISSENEAEKSPVKKEQGTINGDTEEPNTDEEPIAATTAPKKRRGGKKANKKSTPDANKDTSLDELSKAFYHRHYEALSSTPLADTIIHAKEMDSGMMIDGFWKRLPHYEIKGTRAYGRGDVFHRIKVENLRDTEASTQRAELLHFESQYGLCDAAKFFHEYRNNTNTTDPRPWPHVAIVGLNRDFGALSTSIKNYTNPRHQKIKEWKKMGCSQEFVKEYMDHPETLAIVTSQFQMWDHPKAHSIPIGFHREYTARDATKHLKKKGPSVASDRPRLVAVNFNANNRYNRKQIIARLKSPEFAYPNGTRLEVENTYVKKGANINNYFKEVLGSKFVLSPGGFGLDCYRHWEALFVGSIPVIEHLDRRDGWYRTFDDLPVAWIDRMTNITPGWLEEEYRRILRNADAYNWEKLQLHYWSNFVLGFLPRCEDTKSKQVRCLGWMGPEEIQQLEAWRVKMRRSLG